MNIVNNTGRLIGILLLVQLSAGIAVNFFLTGPLFGSPGFIVNGAIYSQQIGLAVLVGLLNSGLSVAIAILAFPTFLQHSQAAALWYVALAVVGLSVSAVENINMMSLVSFSEAYTAASIGDRDLLEAIRTVVSSARNWAHYVNLILSGCTLLILYSVLFRFTLVPRLLATFGIAAVLLQLIAVAMPLFGGDMILPLLAPLALSQIALALWLITKGLKGKEAELEEDHR